jgi:hypothetical protein
VAVKSPEVSPGSAVSSGSRPVKFSLSIKGGAFRSVVTRGNRSLGVSLHSTSGAAKPEAAASQDTRWPWNDPLDQQMNRAGTTVMQVREHPLALTSGPGLIQYQFEKIGKGIDEGSF